jgi:imidazolonepropionase-like amidohydrolase
MNPITQLAVLLLLQGEVTVLRSTTLIDVEAVDAKAARHAGTSIVFAGDEILAVGPDEEVSVPDGATVIDGKGKFVIPGLFDMHVHLAGVGDEAMAALVAHGVTSVRDLGGDLELLDEALARVGRGELVGPRAARAGFVLEERGWLERVLALRSGDSPEEGGYLARTRIPISSRDDVMEAVARVYESEADVLKFRNTPVPSVFRFLMEEAQLAGLRVAGHEPNSIGLLEAVSLGMGSLEHTPINAIISGTTDEGWQEIFAAMVANSVHTTPTLVTLANRRMSADELEQALIAEHEDARWPTLTPALVDSWNAQVQERRSENSSIDWNVLLDRSEAVVRDMHSAGVPFLAGTDLGVALVYPGSGLHEELVALVERVGLSPIEALRSATVNAAGWLGWERLGVVRVGHHADLVLLDADPLEDIANVARIHTVVSRGVSYGPAERAGLLREVPAVRER